jgi:hypothetical protein
MNAIKALERNAPTGRLAIPQSQSTSAFQPSDPFIPAVSADPPAAPRLGLMLASGLALLLTCAVLAGAAVFVLLALSAP